jgi:hypothetical protein
VLDAESMRRIKHARDARMKDRSHPHGELLVRPGTPHGWRRWRGLLCRLWKHTLGA